jgi:hypothetical protein
MRESMAQFYNFIGISVESFVSGMGFTNTVIIIRLLSETPQARNHLHGMTRSWFMGQMEN